MKKTLTTILIGIAINSSIMASEPIKDYIKTNKTRLAKIESSIIISEDDEVSLKLVKNLIQLNKNINLAEDIKKLADEINSEELELTMNNISKLKLEISYLQPKQNLVAKK